MRVEGFDGLRVVKGAVDATAPGHADHQRHAEVAVRPVTHASGLGDDLVEGRMDEVGELDLRNGEHAVERHADRDADDAGLGERRVDHPLLAELVEESQGDAEDAAARPDVLAQDDDPIVGGHLVVQSVVDRRHDVLLGHVDVLREHVAKQSLRVGVRGVPSRVDLLVDIGLHVGGAEPPSRHRRSCPGT